MVPVLKLLLPDILYTVVTAYTCKSLDGIVCTVYSYLYKFLFGAGIFNVPFIKESLSLATCSLLALIAAGKNSYVR